MNSVSANPTLPLLNLHGLRKDISTSELLDACRRHGCFSIINTGFDDHLMDDVFAQANRLFSLADDDPIKQAVNSERNEGGTGWSALYKEPAYTAGTVAHVESFDCGPYHSDIVGLPYADSLGLHPSCWPEIPGFRYAVRECWDRLQVLGQSLYSGFARMLDLEPGFFSKHCTSRAPSTLRLLHYPLSGEVLDKRVVGISEHSDFECFTVIHQTAPGLEIRDVNGCWRRAPAEPGRFVVLLGDMLERWTNGYLTATRHRVPNTPWERHSIVMFFAADADCTVQPLPQFIRGRRPARYPAITQHQHIECMMKMAELNREPDATPTR